MTQQLLGERIGVSNTAISRWESDIDQPQFALLAPLGKVLRVSLDELISGELPSRKPQGVGDSQSPMYDVEDSAERDAKLIDAIMGLPAEKKRALLMLLI